MSLAVLTTLVLQVTEPSSALVQSASILLSLPVALPGPRSHPSVCALAYEAPDIDIINRKGGAEELISRHRDDI